MSNEVLKGSLHFAKMQANWPNKDWVRMEVRDESSGLMFLTVDLTLEEATQAILFSGFVDVDLELNGLDKIGMKREHKNIVLELPDNLWEYRYQIAAAEELDGWKASEYDLKKRNHHHVVAGGGYSVGYTRWVEVEDEN